MKRAYLLGIVAAEAFLCVARGDIIPSITTATDVTAIGGDFAWNYTVTLTQDENALTTDFFTIYDFGGFVPGQNSQPTGWTFTASLLGTTPTNVTPTDDPTLWNLTWTYTGDTLNGPQTLGLFTAVSDTNLAQTGQFASQATRAVGDLAGTKIDNIGNVAVPVPEMSALLPMIALCTLGAVSWAMSVLRRRRA